MNCPINDENSADVLIDYTAGRLDQLTISLVEQHVAICATCARFVREQDAVWKALDAWEPEVLSTGFNRRLWSRIDALEAAPWHTRVAHWLRFADWKPAFPLAAAIVIIGAGFFFDHANTSAARGVPGIPGVSVGDVEQVEQTLDDIQLLRQFNSLSAPSQSTSSSQPM